MPGIKGNLQSITVANGDIGKHRLRIRSVWDLRIIVTEKNRKMDFHFFTRNLLYNISSYYYKTMLP